jgi:hypothetical protein
MFISETAHTTGVPLWRRCLTIKANFSNSSIKTTILELVSSLQPTFSWLVIAFVFHKAYGQSQPVWPYLGLSGEYV